MPKYSYSAIDLHNRQVSDTVDARDDADFRRILRNQGLVPLKYRVEEEQAKAYRLKAGQVAEFSRQLAGMLGSGITVVRAMEILKDRDGKPRLKLVYEKLYKDVQQGYTLSEAMGLQAKAFPGLLINMYASGEASGQLEQVAAKMAVHYEKEHRLNGKVLAALTYPLVLLVALILVVMIIFTMVLPKFFKMFENIEMPPITQVVMAVSGFMQQNWYWVVIVALMLVALCQYLLTIPSIALKADHSKIRAPIVGKLLKIIYTARFARTLSSLYSSGLSMITALEVTATIINNKYIEGQFGAVIRDVRNGEPLSAAVGGIDGMDKKLATSILIGEEAGRLDSMLEATAESFDYEAEMATGRLVQLVEPLMLIIMAVVILAIMVSVLLPILTIYQGVGTM